MGEGVIELTVDDYLTRFGEVFDDFQLTGLVDGKRIGRAKALAQINLARRGVQRELLRAGIVESRFGEKVPITADAIDTDRYDLPARQFRLIAIVETDDEKRVYRSVRSRHRVGDRGYLHEQRSIRWFNMDPPAASLSAIVIREPVTLSLGTAQSGSATGITFASSPDVGRSIQEDDHYNGVRIAILSGTGLLQKSIITDFVGSTLVATAVWGTAPDNTSVYSLMEDMPSGVVDAVVLRAAHNMARFDREYDDFRQELFGESRHAFNSVLSELLKPTSSSADGPRIVETWVT